MTSFQELIGFETDLELDADSWTKYYFDLPPEHLVRIVHAATTLSVYQLGPPILGINFEDGLAITYEKITPFQADVRSLPELSTRRIRREITKKVKLLHNLGWVHGDLNIFNLGYKKDGKKINFYILDPDTMFKVNNQYPEPEEWLQDWVEAGYDEPGEEAAEILKEMDTISWQGDWLV